MKFLNSKKVGVVLLSIFISGFLNIERGFSQSPDPKGIDVVGTIQGVPKAKQKKGVLVYIEKVDGEFKPTPFVMDQKSITFVPYLLPIVTGATVEFVNSDPVLHTVQLHDAAGENCPRKINLATLLNQRKSIKFERERGVGKCSVTCGTHAEMLAFIAVLQNPYFSVANEDGHFEIKGVAPGTYVLKAWAPIEYKGSQNMTVSKDMDNVTMTLTK